MWSPPNYKDALDAVGFEMDSSAKIHAANTRSPLHGWLHSDESISRMFSEIQRPWVEAGRASKPTCSCGRAVHDFVLVDCRNIGHGTQDWACDGCWTSWEMSGQWPDGSEFTLEQWVVDHGAPRDVRSRMKSEDKLRRPLRQRAKRRK